MARAAGAALDGGLSGYDDRHERHRISLPLEELRPPARGWGHFPAHPGAGARGALRLPAHGGLALDLRGRRARGLLSERIRGGRAGVPEAAVSERPRTEGI